MGRGETRCHTLPHLRKVEKRSQHFSSTWLSQVQSLTVATVPGEAQTLSSNKTAKRLHLFSQSVRIAAQCSFISENTSERVSERARAIQRAGRQGRDGATDTVNNSDHQTSQFSLQFHLKPCRRLDETKPIDLSVLHLDPLTSLAGMSRRKQSNPRQIKRRLSFIAS